MKNVPEPSHLTYSLFLCKKHAKDFLYANEMEFPGGYCGYGCCTNITEYEIYLTGLANSSSYTPKGKQDENTNNT